MQDKRPSLLSVVFRKSIDTAKYMFICLGIINFISFVQLVAVLAFSNISSNEVKEGVFVTFTLEHIIFVIVMLSIVFLTIWDYFISIKHHEKSNSECTEQIPQ
jgi:uncharacterized membrane protein